MLRALLVLFLIGGLLTCPLRCSAMACGDAVRGEAGGTSCSCCTADPAAAAEARNLLPECSGPECPGEECPGSDCTCGSCICNGAVSEHDEDPQLAASQLADLGLGASPIAATVPAPTQGDVLRHRSLGSSLLDGRAVRIAHQSLQI